MSDRSLSKFHLLTVFAQAAVAVIPCVWVLQVLGIWWLLHSVAGSDHVKAELIAASVMASVAIVAVIGVQLGQSWGWSWALLVNLVAVLVLVLGLISGSRPPRQLAVCFALFMAAGAVLILPGVRAFYSQHSHPWPLTWWQRKRENEREQLVRLAFAIGQLFVSLSGWILLLAFLPYTEFAELLPFGVLGLAASVKLFTGHRTGVLLTLAWAGLGLLSIATAERGHLGPLRGSLLLLAVYFLVNGFYASALLARRLAHQS
jgi:hypothetical protein